MSEIFHLRQEHGVTSTVTVDNSEVIKLRAEIAALRARPTGTVSI